MPERASTALTADPFLITGPAVISFSGGATSGCLLSKILRAYDGALPHDVKVAFENTGREMPGTLDFVAECAARWNVEVVWLEYRRDAATGHVWTERVDHNSASRAGEPFAMMLEARRMLPNPFARFCTTELKVRTLKRWVMSELRWSHWTSVLGLRADEMHRVERNTKRKPERWQVVCPLAAAGFTKVDVMRFWAAQPFSLRLAGAWEGNCDGCFLKSRGAIMRMIHDHPDRLSWWADMEATRASKLARKPRANMFRMDRDDYATMARDVRDQGVLPMTWLEEALPCTSGGCGI